MMAGTETILLDAAQRETATTDFDNNLIVAAGAGTGKTSLLIERTLNALGSGLVTVHETAAITFTEKAAGELRQRLADGLERLRALGAEAVAADTLDLEHEAHRSYRHLRSDGVAPQELERRCLDAMEQLDRATVTTIHGFCSELLRAYPSEAGVDPDFAVDSGEQAETLRRRSWDEFILRELGPQSEREELWSSLLEIAPLETMGALGRALADFKIPARHLQPPFEFPSSMELFGEQADSLIARVADVLERQRGMTDPTRRIISGLAEALTALRDEGLVAFRNRIAADEWLAAKVEDNRRPTPNKGLQRVSAAEFKSLVRELFKLCKQLTQVDDELMARLLEAVAPYALAFREELLRQGFVSFDGLLALTRDLLRDHPEVRRRLKQRFRMLLVDEFQDTDPRQYEIVFFLAEAVEGKAKSAYATKLGAGRLFVVGDAKQSIYRFRGADHAAYRSAMQHIEDSGGQSLDLTSNFRSVDSVLAPVNRLFEAADGCWNASDYQPDYVPINAVRKTTEETPRVELWTVDIDSNTRAEARRDAEGNLLAREIDRLVRKEQRCSFRQITIQLRAFTKLPQYLRPLRESAIPFIVDGGRDFLKRPEVGQLIATLRTLAQPGDQPALLAFLRAPAGGISDAELAAYATEKGRWDWRTSPDAESFPQLAERFEFLRELAAETCHLPVDARIRRVVERALLLPLGAAAFEGAQRVANLRKLTTTAAEMAYDGRLSLNEVVDALREGRIADLENDPPLADDAADAVLITNIHKMKGLENDWVFLPDMARAAFTPQFDEPARVARDEEGDSALALKVGGISNGIRVEYEAEHMSHEAAEEVRVLYVALTRARERLILLSAPSRSAAPWITALGCWGYDTNDLPADEELLADGSVLHRLMEPALPKIQGDVEATRESDEALRRYARAIARAQGYSAPFARPSDEEADAQEPSREAPQGSLFDWAEGPSVDARAVGQAAHFTLEYWDGEIATLDAALAPAIERAVQETGAERDAVTTEVRELLRSFAGSELGERFRTVERLGREVPIVLRDGERVYRGSIDLLYRDGDGSVVVADYKTDRETTPETVRAHYAEQLRVYRSAVAASLGLKKEPMAELWILRSGARIGL